MFTCTDDLKPYMSSPDASLHSWPTLDCRLVPPTELNPIPHVGKHDTTQLDNDLQGTTPFSFR